MGSYWLSIVTTVLSGFVGYVYGIVTKPSFRYLGITGNLLGASPPFSAISSQTLQCSARFEVAYLWGLRKGPIARNSRGWVAVYNDGGGRVHNAPTVWAWDHAVSVDVVGEESLVLFHVYPVISDPNESALIVIPSPKPQSNTWHPYESFRCLDYNDYLTRLNGDQQLRQQLSQVCDIKANGNFKLEFMVASENAHGIGVARKALTLREALDKCLKSRGGKPIK